MTNQQRNIAVRKLTKEYAEYINKPRSEEDEKEREEIKKEFHRLYYAGDLQTLSKNSILLMIRLNLSLRVIPFHMFGIDIKLTK